MLGDSPRLSVLILSAALWPAASTGQDPRRSAEPSDPAGFGPGQNVLFIPATAFVPLDHTTTFFFGLDLYLHRNLTGLSDTFVAPVELPSGASVTSVCALTYDDDTDDRADLYWEGLEMGSIDADPYRVEIANVTTGNFSAPGYNQTCLPLARPTDIRKYEDLDGDGTRHPTSYFVRYVSTTGGASIGLGGFAIRWVRTVSPAPAAATFADVPTSFAYFRAVEALTASGISGGCGGGNFCPNKNVTRGEMAAFFARALGLYEADLPPAP